MTTARDAVPPLGARLNGDGTCSFAVWAPAAARVAVRLVDPEERLVPLEPHPHGYHIGYVDGVQAGNRYCFRLDGAEDRPDPCSRLQPDGVHGPSAVVETGFGWSDDDWRGLPLAGSVFYELHVGTFTPAGTFDAIVPRLADLADLGITTIELMPVAHFPGDRNWGYDGVFPFAAHTAYGGPAGLKTLVDAAHRAGIAVALDVVYNHLGPEGNYLGDFGPYFTDRYRTPWGSAINFDGAGSDEVRRYFIENALQWIDEFHIDALRLDAVHAIVDESAYRFLHELADRVHERAEALGREVHLIAESDLNDPRLVRPARIGGYGLDGQWSDDFHHALHALLTGERQGYYTDFGDADHLAAAFRSGYVYTGQYSRFRERRHGAPPTGIAPDRLLVYAQNHDQIGNRLAGDRLTSLLSTEQLELAAATLLLSPFTPLLFMGEEYGETAQFPYFVSHTDPELVEAVLRGRREEFARFEWQATPPDPHSEATFRSAILDWDLRDRTEHARRRQLHARLIELRRQHPVLTAFDAIDVSIAGDRTIIVDRRSSDARVIAAFDFGGAGHRLELPAGEWTVEFDSSDSDARTKAADRPVSGSFPVPAHGVVMFASGRE